MFIIYIDNLAKLLEQNNVTAKLFADDVKLYLEIDTDEDRVKFQVVLDLITDWANAWQLQVSVAKFNILNIGNSTITGINYYIDGHVLPVAESCRDLGITITENLSMSRYINEIAVKANERVNCILRSFVSGGVKLLVRAFTVYVRPVVEYNTVIWSPYLINEIELIEKV